MEDTYGLVMVELNHQDLLVASRAISLDCITTVAMMEEVKSSEDSVMFHVEIHKTNKHRERLQRYTIK